MNEYLKTTLEKLNTQKYAVLNIVLGNESCDLDSAVSAIVYATFLHWEHEQLKCKVCTRNKRSEEDVDDIFVPVLNVERGDYEIKTEVAFCLQQHGISKEDLVFKNDPNLPCLLSSSKTNIILVDHHTLAASDQHLTPLVTEIIDHRPIDKSQWGYKEGTRSTIELVGSCATLVSQRIMDLSALFAKDVDFFMANVACCDMLHSTIILDTVNFSKEVDKATPHDEEVALLLETILKPEDYEVDRANKLHTLVLARRDVSTLAPAQLFRKDLKVVEDILVPSFPILVKNFLSQGAALDAVSAALGRGGGAALLLGIHLEGGLARDMAVSCADEARRDQLCTFLQDWKPSFDLAEEQLPDRSADQSSVRYFSQMNLSASRKQYMPALKEFLSINK